MHVTDWGKFMRMVWARRKLQNKLNSKTEAPDRLGVLHNPVKLSILLLEDELCLCM